MKRILIKLFGVICILTSLILIFLPSCVTVNNISRKEFREFKTEVLGDLERVEEAVLIAFETDDFGIEEEFEDCDLPSTKGTIKKRFRETKSLLKDLMNENVSLKEVFTCAVEIPRFIEDTNNLLETDIAIQLITETSELVSVEEIEDIIDLVIPFKFVFNLITIFLCLVVVVALMAIIAQIINRMSIFKSIYLGITLSLSVALLAIIPFVSSNLAYLLSLPEYMEDISLNITAIPFISLAFALVPIILDTISYMKSKKQRRIK